MAMWETNRHFGAAAVRACGYPGGIEPPPAAGISEMITKLERQILSYAIIIVFFCFKKMPIKVSNCFPPVRL